MSALLDVLGRLGPSPALRGRPRPLVALGGTWGPPSGGIFGGSSSSDPARGPRARPRRAGLLVDCPQSGGERAPVRLRRRSNPPPRSRSGPRGGGLTRTGCEVDGCHDQRLALLQLPAAGRPTRQAFEFGGRHHCGRPVSPALSPVVRAGLRVLDAMTAGEFGEVVEQSKPIEARAESRVREELLGRRIPGSYRSAGAGKSALRGSEEGLRRAHRASGPRPRSAPRCCG